MRYDRDELAYMDNVPTRDNSRDYYNDRRKKPKKKRTGLRVFIIVLIILALLATGVVIGMKMFSKDKSIDVDLTKTMAQLTLSGYDGEAVLDDITVNNDSIDRITVELDSDKQREAVVSFFESVVYTADKTEGLTNGDVITIKASYDASLAEKAMITVTADGTTYTVEGLGEDESKLDVETPQWFRNITEDGDEIMVTCLLLADPGTSVTLPIGFMFCRPGGAMAEMFDTSGSPNLTYKGTGYYIEDGFEAPYGKVAEISKTGVKYSVKQYGDSFSINIEYSINDDGTMNVKYASGGEVPIPTGLYEPVSSASVKALTEGN